MIAARSGSAFQTEFFAQCVCGLQICSGDFFVYAHGGFAGGLVVHSEIQVPAAHGLPHGLADARLDRLEAFRHANVQIEEAVIHGANGGTRMFQPFSMVRASA